MSEFELFMTACGIDTGVNQFAYIDPNRQIRTWCRMCKRSIDGWAMQNTYAPCPYCADKSAKLHSDPLDVR